MRVTGQGIADPQCLRIYADFERRLHQFKGFGPVTVRIFMREAGHVLFPS